MIHPLAWMVWLAAALATASATRNPLLLLLALLAVGLVEAAVPRDGGPLPRLRLLPLTIGLAGISGLLNMLSVRAGSTVLARIPGWVPLLGGPLTAEALVYGACGGLALATIVAAFLAAQRGIPLRALIGLFPPALAPLALAATVALTFVPQILLAAQEIREAQLIRGHRFGGLRSWLPLLLALLAGGLERSLDLAESLAARGVAFGAPPQRGLAARLAPAAALTLAIGGWGAWLAGQAALGPALMLCGAAGIAAILWRAPAVRRTAYRERRWRGRDSAIALLAGFVIVSALAPLPGIDRAALAFYPYPALMPPRFDIAFGVATLGLAAPGLALWWIGR